MAGQMVSLILKLRKSAPFCFSSTFGCFDELELNHVSKFHVRTLKTERGTAILVKSWLLGSPACSNTIHTEQVRAFVFENVTPLRAVSTFLLEASVM